MPFAFLLAAGLASAFCSGLLGIGGAVVLIPLLRYTGPAAGLSLDMHGITSLSMVYVAAAGLSGFWSHRRHGAVHAPLVLWLGLGAGAGSLAGGYLQTLMSPTVLVGVFALLAAAAGVSMLFPPHRERSEVPRISPLPTLAGSIPAGFLAATAGVGGASLLLPFMIMVLGVPTRIAVGTSLPLVLVAGLFGAVGRAGSGDIPWTLVVPLLIGALPGAQLGGWASRRLPTAFLRRAFAVLVLSLAVGMGSTIL